MDLHKEYEKFATHHDHAKETQKRYRSAIDNLLEMGFDRISDNTLITFRDTRREQGMSHNTIRGEMAKLLAFGRWLKSDFSVEVPRMLYRTPKAFSMWQVHRLWYRARKTKRTVYGIPGHIYWPAILGLCWDTAERIGAITELRRCDVDLAAGMVLYRAETRKGRIREQMRKISRRTAVALKRLIEHQKIEPHELLFIHGHKGTVWKAYGQLLDDAGLPSSRDYKFHCLRRSHATHLHRKGGDATASLGQSSDAVTRFSYLDPRYTGEGENLRRLPCPLGWWGRVREWCPW